MSTDRIQDFVEQLQNLFAGMDGGRYLEAAVILVSGLLIAWITARRLPLSRLHPQHQLILRRVVSYVILGVTFTWTLRALGVSLGVLMGTAGILTVAVGFAAQTSASNLISGLFLMGEQPFRIGDFIEIEERLGEVVSIGLLSVRVRTLDNLLVRVPNETMLKKNVVNLTHYPVRRFDLQVGVHYRHDLAMVRRALLAVADRNPRCLEEPAPKVFVLGFGDSAVNLQLSVWATQSEFVEFKSQIQEQIKAEFDARGIEIPFPQRVLVVPPDSRPFPVVNRSEDPGRTGS